MDKLKNKVAIVTGASKGIGKAIALHLGHLGASVLVNYRSSEAEAKAVAEEIVTFGSEALTYKADMANVEEINQMFQYTIGEFGKVDIVIANAGIELVDQSVLDFTEEHYNRLFNVNTKGSFFTLQNAAKHIENQGRIIYIGSSTTSFPMPGHGLYGGSKYATLFLVEVLAKEIGFKGVTVNSILPTATEGAGVSTDGLRQNVQELFINTNPMKRAGTVEDVTHTLAFLLSEKASYISGQHLLLSGGAAF